jgi:ribosomal protein S13
MTNKRINFIQNFNRISDFTKMNKSTVFIDLISKVNNNIEQFRDNGCIGYTRHGPRTNKIKTKTTKHNKHKN